MFGVVHFCSFFGGVVFGSGEVIKAVGDVEGEFVVYSVMKASCLDGSIDVDYNVAAPVVGFAGNGVVAKADDVGGSVFTKIFAVGLGDAVVVDQDDGDFAPAVGGGLVFELLTEPISQFLKIFQVEWMGLLLI